MATYEPDGRTRRIRAWAATAGDSQYFPFVSIIIFALCCLFISRALRIQPTTRTVSQAQFEGFLREHLARLDVHVEKSTDLVGLSQDDVKVIAHIKKASGETQTFECAYLVAADGAKGAFYAVFQLAFLTSRVIRAYSQATRHSLRRTD